MNTKENFGNRVKMKNLGIKLNGKKNNLII